MRIKCIPEGRKDIFLPQNQSLIAWIISKKFKRIHNFTPAIFGVVGADHPVKSVIEDIIKSYRTAILIGDAQVNNFNHALSIITDNQLKMYDIGKITIKDLEVSDV